MIEPYAPVDCEFHDVLESLATLRKRARIVFRGPAGDREVRDAMVTDVFVRDSAEYLQLDNGETIRLDRLIEADGVALPETPTNRCALPRHA
jgi:Rho-binding antiterminator